MNDSTSIMSGRREAAIEAHVANELSLARYLRNKFHLLALEIEGDPSKMSWFRGYDKTEVAALLRDIANFSDVRVARMAKEEAVGLVNEGKS